MVRNLFVAALIAATAGLAELNVPLYAQAPQSAAAARNSNLANIRASIVWKIGAGDQTIEVTSTDKILTVLRVNSHMNQSTHTDRNNEAMAIGETVAGAIEGRSEFKSLIVIRVEYVSRPVGGKARIIDTVDFRKDPKGIFQFHQT